MDILRSLAGVGVILGWAAIIVLLGVFTTIAACILVPDKRPADIADDAQVLDEPLTTPGLNHPAYRALAKRKTWADEQGDHYTTAPVDEIIPFVEPPCTCPPDDKAICDALEADFTVVEQSAARSINRNLSKLPNRSHS